MNLFLDANILVTVLNKEYPAFTYCSRILSLADNKKFTVFTSPICLAIAWYFAEKKSGNQIARAKIEMLCKHINIADSNSNVVNKTIANKKIHDFEDGLEYYSAIEKKCKIIITENVDDFYFSDIEILQSKAFVEKYLL